MSKNQTGKSTRQQREAFSTYRQNFAVDFEYPVHFTSGVFDTDNHLLAETLDRFDEGRRHRAAVVVDAGLVESQRNLIGRIKEYFHHHSDEVELITEPMIVPGGESAKNDWGPVRDLMWMMGNLHLDRQSYMIAVGGGAVLDMAGFAASIVHRGLRVVRVPTTVLAQNDAGVGVKNGMNEHGQKNFVGTFAPPFAVINDLDMVATLNDAHWRGGIAEAFKVAILKDREFFDYLCSAAADLKNRNREAMDYLIYRCAQLHLEHIRTEGDPFEFGRSRPLDFGHWAGHQIETMTDYKTGHGQAVSIGIAIDSCYAAEKGLLKPEELERILAGLGDSGLPMWHECLRRRNSAGELKVLDGLDKFREHLGGELTITLPDGIGHKVEVHHMDTDLIEQAVRTCRSRHHESS